MLLTGAIPEALREAYGDYHAMFSAYFATLGYGWSVVKYDLQAGDYPLDINECDAYVISGAAESVFDDHEWIHPICDYVCQLHDAKKKTLGICFGHQMMAVALGGRCERSANGWGLGVRRMEIIEEAPWMSPQLSTYTLLYSHQDQVTRLPDEATLHAGNNHCPVGMFSVGDHFLALQGHPEFNIDYARDLIQSRHDRIPKGLILEAVESMTQKIDKQEIGRWIERFLNA
ncbi:MAG: GMP synthase [Magnetococcales bacterium]|nr:GMP synthase [Magnetococcales bacterium]